MANLQMDISAEDKASESLKSVASSVGTLTEAQKKQAEATARLEERSLALMQIEAKAIEQAKASKTADDERRLALMQLAAKQEDLSRATKQAAHEADAAARSAAKYKSDVEALAAAETLETEAAEARKSAALEGAAALAAGFAAVVAFSRGAVEAYAEEERANRRLKMAVGDLSDALGEQADALEKSLGVSGEQVKEMQAMLYHYGVAPAEIDRTVRALLDYAAASGTDALAATQELVQSVESGKKGFKELGLVYDETGTKSEQVSKLTTALAAKLGGSAAAQADTLEGRGKLAAVAMDDIKKSWAAMLDSMEQRAGVLDKTARLLNWIRRGGASEDEPSAAQDAAAEMRKHEQDLLAQAKAVSQQIDDMRNMPKGLVNRATLDAMEKDLARINAEIAAAQGQLAHVELRETKNKNDGITGKDHREAQTAALAAAKKQREEEFDEAQKGREEATAEMQKQGEWEAALLEKQNAERQKLRDQERDAAIKSHHELFMMRQEQAKKVEEWDKRQLELEKQNAKAEADFQKQLGEQVGGAFAQGMASAISELGKGGEVDIASILIDIMVTAAGMGLTATGFGYLAPITTALGGVAKGTLKRHEGGWIDAPRYHSGAWVGADEQPAILQTGERVLSRAEVRTMGGQSGVESAARGSGGAPITVQTFDGQTTRDFFERAGGRALLNAVRTGRGAPALLFGGG